MLLFRSFTKTCLQYSVNRPAAFLSLQGAGAQQLALLEQTRQFSTPHWQNVNVDGDGEPESTIIKSEDSHTFTIRCPNKHETRNEGATPIAHFLGAIVSGSQAALMSSAKDLNLQVGHVKWHATGKYDVRGVRGEEGAVSQLKGISIVAELDSNASGRQLEELRRMVQLRSILANTMSNVQGLDFVVEYKSTFNFQSSMGTHM